MHRTNFTRDAGSASVDFPAAEITKIIDESLPSWKAACESDADVVLFTQSAFGNSSIELFLLAVAIKYAGIAGKDVTIAH